MIWLSTRHLFILFSNIYFMALYITASLGPKDVGCFPLDRELFIDQQQEPGSLKAIIGGNTLSLPYVHNLKLGSPQGIIRPEGDHAVFTPLTDEYVTEIVESRFRPYRFFPFVRFLEYSRRQLSNGESFHMSLDDYVRFQIILFNHAAFGIRLSSASVEI